VSGGTSAGGQDATSAGSGDDDVIDADFDRS
jgi:hypothetical protein